jgi:6-phosphogluconate dehydrogenase
MGATPTIYARSRDRRRAYTSNIKLIQEVAGELKENLAPLKRVIAKGIESDAHMPTLSSGLEYLRYESGKMLLAQFMKAEMDFFGAHAFDRPGVKKRGS